MPEQRHAVKDYFPISVEKVAAPIAVTRRNLGG
jgi:hypothetical protein